MAHDLLMTGCRYVVVFSVACEVIGCFLFKSLIGCEVGDC